MAPTTDWKEVEPADEAVRLTALTQLLLAWQKDISSQQGPGRALHRKQVLGLRGRVEVLGGLPEHARHGLFAQPGTYDALLRASNGAAQRQKDSVPDIRGLALKVLGVAGESALGPGPTDCQDFLLINSSRFSFATGIEFLEFLLALRRGTFAMFGHMLGRYGFAAVGRLGALRKALGLPFSGFATETFHSTNPLCCGPYAMKLRLLPTHGQPPRPNVEDLTGELAERVRAAPLTFDLQGQFFVSETATPIEKADQDWSQTEAPFVTLAQVTLPQQDSSSAEGQATAQRCEGERFDPWRALRAHRPLGSVMRARRAAYFGSAQARGAVA